MSARLDHIRYPLNVALFRGRKVTALGVIFDFTGNDKNTTVQKVEDMVKETWFKEAIKDEPDFFLLTGYVWLIRSFVRELTIHSPSQPYACATGQL